MKIEDKLTEKLTSLERVNDNLIYLVDYEIEIVKITKSGKGKIKSTRRVSLKNELWENNPGKEALIFYNKELNRRLEVKDNEIMEIKKVILKKEISCSFYKR